MTRYHGLTNAPSEFQEAMDREMNELADQIGGLSLTPNPDAFLHIDADGNMHDVEDAD